MAGDLLRHLFSDIIPAKYKSTSGSGNRVQRIADWLQKLGLEQYTQSFWNDVEFAILSDLTDQDLEKVGVSSLRRAAFC